MDAPFLLAGGGIDGENIHLGRTVEGAAYDDRTGLKTGVDAKIIDAELLEPRDVRLVYLVEGHVTLGSQRAVVARPVGHGCIRRLRTGQEQESADSGGRTGQRGGEDLAAKPAIVPCVSHLSAPHCDGASYITEQTSCGTRPRHRDEMRYSEL